MHLKKKQHFYFLDLSCTNFTLITILSKTYKENLDDGSDERAGNYLSIFFGLGLAFFILAILTYLFRKFLRLVYSLVENG